MTVNTNKTHKIILALIPILVINSVMAQRPSFAGSRPANGLSQKDKYLSTTPGNAEFSNRFGGSDNAVITNTIAFGQPQNPPIGYPIVKPESSYSALVPSTRPSSSNTNTNSVAFENRFGDGDTNSSASTVRPAALPLDAQGDQQLINQLNQLPVDKRPFWFLNYQAIEAQRNGTVTNNSGVSGARGSFLG